MIDDPPAARAEYEQLLANFKAADSHASGLARIVSRAGSLLANSNWQRTIVSGYDFPRGFATGGSTCIGGDEWPTMRQLGEALAGWHRAKRAAQEGYSRVPAESRGGLEAPPG